jgi:hypothetical protein
MDNDSVLTFRGSGGSDVSRSDFEDFLFLLLDRIVDLLHVLIGQLLNFRFRFS